MLRENQAPPDIGKSSGDGWEPHADLEANRHDKAIRQ